MYTYKDDLRKGMQAGIPIALAYFAVSMALGISAKNAGLTVFQGFLSSVLLNASAGQYAGYQTILHQAPYLELVLITLIVNARYILMSMSLSQKLREDSSFLERLILSFYLTDEYFGLAISQDGYINPRIIYGAILVASPAWALGIIVGIALGNTLPLSILNSLSVALYGMFLAIIIPPCKDNKVLFGVVSFSFLASYIFTIISALSTITEGTRIIILTIVISSLAAYFFPIKVGDTNE